MAEENKVTPVEENSTDLKHILVSKTFWVNALAFIAYFVQAKFGFVIDEDLQLQALALINMFLRAVTKEPVRWK
jgi:hypothetical protein